MSYDLGRIIEDSLNEIYLFDAETLNYRFINKGARENLGYTKREMVKLTPLDINPQHDPASFAQLLSPLKSGESDNIQIESIHRRKDGSDYPVNIGLQMSSYRRKPCYLAIISDISDRKGHEKRQLDLEAQLRQSQKLEAVGTMAGGIAHDFNNILQGLYLYSGIIKKQLPEDEQLHANFQHIVDSGDRAKDLVKQILTFSRKEDTDLKPVKIQYLIKNALKLTRASTPTTIEITDQIDSDCGPILCDSTQIHQVFINICNNAIHAMRESGGKLTVSLKKIDAQIEIEPGQIRTNNNGVAELLIMDSGHGMEADILEKIFDPFFTTKDTDEGTGLGLSIVHGIIKEINGQVIVDSTPGEGTTFRILMPICAETVTFEDNSEYSEPVAKGVRVLLVDDDKMISGAGRHILEDKGYLVDTANNGEAALELFQRNIKTYDLIITDLTMPKMTGLELTKAIRKLSKDVYIILTSGNLDPKLQIEFESLGFNGFVRKPWTASEMLKSIDSLFPK
jgi:PAS domain S-box-containing protein